MPQSSGALSALCVGSWNLGRLAGQLMALAAHSRRPGWRPGMSDKLPALTAPARSGHGWPLLLRGCPALGTPRLGSRVGKGRLDRYQSPHPQCLAAAPLHHQPGKATLRRPLGDELPRCGCTPDVDLFGCLLVWLEFFVVVAVAWILTSFFVLFFVL